MIINMDRGLICDARSLIQVALGFFYIAGQRRPKHYNNHGQNISAWPLQIIAPVAMASSPSIRATTKSHCLMCVCLYFGRTFCPHSLFIRIIVRRPQLDDSYTNLFQSIGPTIIIITIPVGNIFLLNFPLIGGGCSRTNYCCLYLLILDPFAAERPRLQLPQ